MPWCAKHDDLRELQPGEHDPSTEGWVAQVMQRVVNTTKAGPPPDYWGCLRRALATDAGKEVFDCMTGTLWKNNNELTLQFLSFECEQCGIDTGNREWVKLVQVMPMMQIRYGSLRLTIH